MRLIAVNDISVRHGDFSALENVTFAIEKGEIVTVVGPNGSGKSTLIRTILGILTPNTGKIETKPDLTIGYVPQKLAQETGLPLTVRGFLSLPNRVSNQKAKAALLETGAVGLEQRQISQLSGGQMQRVLLARAILNEPDILILDEPTQGLDQHGAADFYALIERVRDQYGCAVLLVSHDLHVVMSASDRVICLNGHICCQGTPTVVRDAPEYQALFGQGTHGTLALYQHEHDHSHDDCDHDHHHHD
ncbi:MAG: metal ABC transporter ATP-binding protein [Paracoccaceae bacterium]|nr:metal ABC transporter ATP-binding protein [Paracoccaceae bacterium]MDG1739549.1 metal ABC transporter ATP-binding protein [Paracoccaceae bacterium]MDG2258199.1 metal ABC transporter ATP-binding protein [Paracoccaceae bacterium]